MNIYKHTFCSSFLHPTFKDEEILKLLIDDLKILETEGNQLPFVDEPVFGSVIQLMGENLTFK